MATPEYQKRATRNYKERMTKKGFVIMNGWVPKTLRSEFNSLAQSQGACRRQMFADAINLYLTSGAVRENSKQNQ